MSMEPRLISNLQTYRLMVYRRALHPEFFPISNRRAFTFGGYEVETWLSAGAHMIRFQRDGQCVVEVVTPQEGAMPVSGLLASVPCAGEREHEEKMGEWGQYISSVQTEMVSDNLYRATLVEMRDYAMSAEAQMHQWREAEGRQDNLSVLDVQRYHREVHAQAWHMDATCGLVLRSQAIFEIQGSAGDGEDDDEAGGSDAVDED